MIVSTGASAQTVWDGSADTEWEGDGSESSPYLIGSAAELAGMATRTNAGETFEGMYFRLISDLWLSDPAIPDEEKPLWDPIGMSRLNNSTDEEHPDGFTREDHYFKGNFNGNGHTIHNLWYAHDSEFGDNFDDPFNDGTYDFDGWSRALFGNLDGATVTSLLLSNVNIQCMYQGAALACTAKGSVLSDIAVDGLIVCGTSEREGGSAGGIVTVAENTLFERCVSSASVRAVSGAGSLAGQISGCEVRQCEASGRVASMKSAGGMVGMAMAGSVVEDCHSSAQLHQLVAKRQGANVGGFVGVVSGSEVKFCSSTGNLTVDYNGYGFVGSVVDNGLVESCYAICDIVKDGYGVWMTSFAGDIGANHLVGEDPVYGYVRNCYGVASYAYQPCPPDLVTSGNHIGGFAEALYEGSQAVNCFYNSDTATGINSIQPAEEDPQPLWFEFGLTTEYMQSEAFVNQLNDMAGVIGSSLWKYNPGAYPTPTGVSASASDAPFAGGDGSESSPWQIATKENLLDLASITNHGWTFENQFVVQTADILLNAPKDQWGEQMPELWTPIGRYCGVSGGAFRFHGSYDGGLHTVANMYMENNAEGFSGLFGVIGDGARITNLGVTDAYICNGASGKSIVSGILVGSAGLFNDESYGERYIANCWTSGYNESFASSGLVGGLTQWGRTVIDNCYTTAQILSYGYRTGGAFVADEYAGEKNVDLSASYFNGSFVKNGYNDVPELFNMCNVVDCFYSKEAYPTEGAYEYFPMGRTSEYMTTPEFVNELSYASTVAGLENPWRYTSGSTASFFGTAPTVEVTFRLDDAESVTFLAIEGSLITPPAVKAPEEGLTLRGWYDAATSGLFDFANTTVSAPITLEARWNQGILPDYTPFKNKFATTFHIKTPAQLQAFANIVNGEVDPVADGVQKNSFENLTVVLDNDIEWNSVGDYAEWGSGVTPVAFRSVGLDSSNWFKGTFDGQGHSIVGLYVNESLWGSTFGMFTAIDALATVQNLILKNAFIEIGYTSNDPIAGMLVGSSAGRVYRCGAEGKIIVTEAAQEKGYAGGLIGQSVGDEQTTTLRECYAIADADLKSQGFGGLVYTSSGDIHDSYARSEVKMDGFGWFAGLVVVQQRETSAHTSWSASTLDWQWTMDLDRNPGGAVYGSYNTLNTALYYDSTLLGEAFGPESEWIELPSWESRNNPYAMGTALSDAALKRMESTPEFDFSDIWGRRNDMNDGYPYLRWTAPGLDNDEDAPIRVESIAILPASLELKEGETSLEPLKVVVTPADAAGVSLTFESEDPSIATVDNQGFVTGVRSGTTKIIVRVADDSALTAECNVMVFDPLDVGVDGIVSDMQSDVMILTLQGAVVYSGPYAEAGLEPGVYILRRPDGASFKVMIK